MKKVLLAIAAVIFAALAFATLACAEAVNDEIFILDFDAGDKPKGTELPLWGENGECLVWYLDSENKLVCATTAELTYGYTAQTQAAHSRATVAFLPFQTHPRFHQLVLAKPCFRTQTAQRR